MTVPAFSQADLAETAQRIKERLNGDDETLQLLQQLLDMTEQTNEQWQDQLTALQQGQRDIAKAVVMVAKNQSKMQARLADLRKGLVSLHRMTKSQTVHTGKPLSKSLLTKSQPIAAKDSGGMSLEATERLGTLAKTIRGVFGSNGGHSMAYNPALASQMILEGSLSPKQHQVWKRSNRLHDDPYQALQRRKVG